ncbi:hypothetical protein [Streptomyces sp. KR80]|uniref:hypothetical protein n=1 Tax=Streptomyces sp. KR80 TaxID=3457426 RepID=UPI003FD6368D
MNDPPVHRRIHLLQQRRQVVAAIARLDDHAVRSVLVVQLRGALHGLRRRVPSLLAVMSAFS